MKTQLISVTQPLILKESGKLLTAEEFIVYIARVSNPSNQMNTETGEKLIKYLIKNQHWSPFEHVSCTFEIKTSRAIAAQILRHRSFTFQEFSQRYAEVTEMEPIQFRMQGKTNRQVGDSPAKIHEDLQSKVEECIELAQETYNQLIEQGVAKECARMVLPLTTSTTIYMTGTLRSWIHYIQLRSSTHTQKEHRDIAIEVSNQLEKSFPVVFNALKTMESQ